MFNKTVFKHCGIKAKSSCETLAPCILVPIPTASLPIKLLADGLGKTAPDRDAIWASATHLREMNGTLGSWLQSILL